MKGVILAGGRGTRLNPLTEITNKHLLPVGCEPMIWHPIKLLVDSKITDILVITSTHHMGSIVQSLGSGERFGCNFTYKVQEDAKGIADALYLAKDFVGKNKSVVLLGDNIFENSILKHVDAFRAQNHGARVLLTKVHDPKRFGIAALDEKMIIEIEEKPDNPKTNYAVVGCYMYDEKVFDYISQTEPSARGEYEITTVNNLYIHNHALEYSFIEGAWTDAGTFDSLHEANELLLKQNRSRYM